MHLSYSSSKYKGKVYKSYAIAESHREGNKVKKRIIWPIGKLTDAQAEQIRSICKIAKGEEQFLIKLDDVVVKETRAYLDIAVVDEIWNRWMLDFAFSKDNTQSELSTALVAKILTMNRCINPCSHYSIPNWVEKVALDDILNSDLAGLNDDKIYYELDKIYANKSAIEDHLFRSTYQSDPKSYDFIDYDLTTSYFVGYQCNLSAYGKGKAECHGRRQVLLGVLINNQGYPFKWDVFPGNKAEVKTLQANIDACKSRFDLGGKNVTLVFDRGIISDENADCIDNAKMKYVSALDRNQIPTCGIDIELLSDLTVDQETGQVHTPPGFEKYDDDLYFYDYGLIGTKRFILGFNPVLFQEDRRNRKEKLSFFENYLEEENKQLQAAKKDRKLEATKNRIINELKRLKIKKYYEDPILHPITVMKRLKNGTEKQVKSFTVEINKKDNIIQKEKKIDGVCVFVTNHFERSDHKFKLAPQKIIYCYRNKTKIEDVFKNVKSFSKIRPFFVNTEEHVGAVYTICIISYFINKYLANLRKEKNEKDLLNSKNLYGPFKDIDIATLTDSHSGRVIKKSVEISKNTKVLLKKIGMLHLIREQ